MACPNCGTHVRPIGSLYATPMYRCRLCGSLVAPLDTRDMTERPAGERRVVIDGPTHAAEPRVTVEAAPASPTRDESSVEAKAARAAARREAVESERARREAELALPEPPSVSTAFAVAVYLVMAAVVVGVVLLLIYVETAQALALAAVFGVMVWANVAYRQEKIRDRDESRIVHRHRNREYMKRHGLD